MIDFHSIGDRAVLISKEREYRREQMGDQGAETSILRTSGLL